MKLLEVAGLIAVISALFGLGYQKGLMISMGFGNTSGSYEVREVFNSSVLAIFYVFNRLQEMSLVEEMLTNWKLMIVYGGAGTILLVVFSYFHKNKTSEDKGTKGLSDKIRKVLDTYKGSSVFGFVFGIVGYLVTALSGYIIVVSLSLLVFPSAMGMLVASHQMDSLKEKQVCVAANEVKNKSKYTHQCTQISISGKKLMGYIVLENKDGYFVRRNDSFLYISKDGKNCLSSKFVLTESIENWDEFEFDDKDIEEFCGVKKATESPKSK
ncbi:MAG: hypothetical protein V5786_03630 [Psychromonas sp.]